MTGNVRGSGIALDIKSGPCIVKYCGSDMYFYIWPINSMIRYRKAQMRNIVNLLIIFCEYAIL